MILYNKLKAKKSQKDIAHIILDNLESMGAEDIDEKRLEQERFYRTHTNVKMGLTAIMIFFAILNFYKGAYVPAQNMAIGAVIMLFTSFIMIMYPQTFTFQKWFLIIGTYIFITGWIITGGYMGFGLFWTIIFPPMVLFAIEKKAAMFIVIGCLLEIILLLWTPLSMYIYPYDDVIKQRFPFLYISMFAIALLIKGEQDRSDKVRNSMIKAALDYKRKAEQATVAKSEFLSRMSHEIRTPINAIMGMDELILREEINPEIQGYASDIKNASDSLLSLINDILDFSKIESGKLEVVPVEYNLSDLLNDCYHMVSMQMTEKGLDFSIKMMCELPRRLKGDEIRVRQIVINLLTNAYKYTEVGAIDLGVGGSLLDNGQFLLKFVVKDTGKGIKAENIQYIFESFSQVDQKSNRKIEGTGLGLAISKELAIAMGGNIEVSSEYGVGTEFAVTIPQVIVDASPIEDTIGELKERKKTARKPRARLVLPKAHILVVDDVEMNIKIVERLLRDTAITVDTASSGQEALEKCNNTDYDLILMDQMMPVMDGTEAMRAIRKAGGANSEIPIIVLTADAIEGAREEYLAAGFSDYLSKPIRPSELERQLKSMLE